MAERPIHHPISSDLADRFEERTTTLTRDELVARSTDLFQRIAAGTLKIAIDRTLPLKQAADAHRALEGKATTGKVLLVP